MIRSAKLRRSAALLLPWLLLAGSVALVFASLSRPERLPTLWPRWAEIGVLAMGMTAVILTGGIDLSIGSTLALSGVVLGKLWRDGGWPIGPAAAVAVVVGLVCGGVNGAMVVVGVSPLVATLATMALYAGLAMAISGGERIARLPTSFTTLGQGSFAGLPSQVWLLLVVALIAGLIVHRTRFGRYLYAIGDNRTAALFAAVPVRWMELALYSTSGLLAGLVAIFYTARGGAVIPDAGAGVELQTIACVVLGGARVTGGVGGVGKTLLGLAVLAHLDIGLQLLGTQRFAVPWRDSPIQIDAQGRLILIGVLLVLLAALNERLLRRADD